ncbi:MAG: nitroreductase family protein [Gammaproteobacteria bacterium]
MEVFEAIETRRSIKFFDPEATMPEEHVRQLMEAAILSPTAFNIQNWRFVRVRDRQLREQIRQAAWGQRQVTDASLLLVLCMDLMAWNRDPQRYFRHAPPEVARSMVANIHDFYASDPAMQRDEGMRSCGMAAQTLMLAARALGYHSCAMDGFDFKRVGHLIRLPEDHAICMMLAIGKPLQPAFPRSGQIPLAEVFTEDQFD